ncbi:histidine kinase N-terminal 7TM domain-containing protein [Haloarchaeobius sp. HRN-SO-5]|uniref:histidine kinase N-terminal 7TM domain-containing protein n=1 Tax=Haloarchaeobius sp. HRN-SO-5 TaxID=3446118 RepID=UPI003EBBFF20
MSALIVTAVVATLVAWFAYRQRPKPGATWLTVLLLAVAWWAALYALELPLGTVAQRRPYMKLQWLASLTIPVFWLLFALEYTGRDRHLNRRRLVGLFVVPAVTFAFVATFERHTFLYQDVSVVERGGRLVVEHAFGPMFYVGVGYAYLATLVGSLLFVGLVFDRSPTHRRQSAALLAAVVAPLVGNMVHVFDLPVTSLDPTPIAFLVTGVASYLALTQLDLFDAVPVPDFIARDFVVEGMADPVIVVDERDRVVDANPAASTVLGYDPSNALGRDAARTVPGYPGRGDGDHGTVDVETNYGRRYYDVTVSPITDTHDRRIGRVVTMRDVTERTYDEQRLDVLNRVLRHNLRNEMNVVAACAEELESRVDGEDDRSLARTIRETATDVASLGDTARQIEALLDTADRAPAEDLAEMVDRVVDRGEAAYPDGEFAVDWATEADVYCSTTVEPILWSLVENAADHVEVNDPEVTLFVTPGGDEFVSITVADDGPPIPEEERAVLQSGTETPLDHTSGLGVWLAVWGVRSLGGTIDFESSEETGNAVTVHVPAAIEAAAPTSGVDVGR